MRHIKRYLNLELNEAAGFHHQGIWNTSVSTLHPRGVIIICLFAWIHCWQSSWNDLSKNCQLNQLHNQMREDGENETDSILPFSLFCLSPECLLTALSALWNSTVTFDCPHVFVKRRHKCSKICYFPQMMTEDSHSQTSFSVNTKLKRDSYSFLLWYAFDINLF